MHMHGKYIPFIPSDNYLGGNPLGTIYLVASRPVEGITIPMNPSWATPSHQDTHWPSHIAMDYSSLYLPLCGWCPTSRPPKRVETENGKNWTKTRPVFLFGGGTVLLDAINITRMNISRGQGIPTLNPLLLEGGRIQRVVMVVKDWATLGQTWREHIWTNTPQKWQNVELLLKIRWDSTIVLFSCFKYKSTCWESGYVGCELQGRSTLTNTGWTPNDSTNVEHIFLSNWIILAAFLLKFPTTTLTSWDFLGSQPIFGSQRNIPFKRCLDWVVVICHVNSSPGHLLCHTQPEVTEPVDLKVKLGRYNWGTGRSDFCRL